MGIINNFAKLFEPYTDKLFGATWADLNSVKDMYVREFIIEEAEGRLVNSDGLPYSLDLYVLELLDFVQACMGHKSVREQIERAGFVHGGASPFSQMVYSAVALAQITGEDKTMWDMDLNVFLSEETAISANYTPRTASTDLILKLGECFPIQTVEALFDHTQRIFGSTENFGLKEAALQLWDQLLNEYAETEQTIDPNVANGLLDFIVSALGSAGEQAQFLRARGYSVASTLTKAMISTIADKVPELMGESIRASTSDPSDIVQITALRVFQRYRESVPKEQLLPFQASIVTSVWRFLTSKADDDDPEDSQDVLTELMETLRSAITINYSIVLDTEHLQIDIPHIIFAIANKGVDNPHLLALIRDTFDDITEGAPEIYIPLCGKILPSLMEILDTPDNNMHGIALEILDVLLLNGTSPLPLGGRHVLPRLSADKSPLAIRLTKLTPVHKWQMPALKK